jgi:serine phosphatase RsbU (regulator of sigma subunit)
MKAGRLARLGGSIRQGLCWQDRSIRWQLLCVINVVVGTGLLLFTITDYWIGLHYRFADRRGVLREEAGLALASIERLRAADTRVVQQYLDAACAGVRSESSLGHDIMVRTQTTTFQATPPDLRSAEGFANPHATMTAGDGSGLGKEPLLIGGAKSADAEVIVSVDKASVLRQSRRELGWRAGQLLLLGAIATAILNLAILRLVVSLVRRFVQTVRRISDRELDVRAEGGPSAEFAYLACAINWMSGSLTEAERQRARQLDKARRIQERLQPPPLHVAGWSICGWARPAEDVGGDFLDFRLIGKNQLIICVGDVAGHGVPAAITAAMLKMLYGAAMDRSTDPVRLLGAVNETFRAVSLDEDFATMAIVLIDSDSGRLKHASAGHETSYVMRRCGSVEPLASTGLPLGLDGPPDWRVAELSLEPGDRLVLLTDGWPEATRGDGRLLGREALVRALKGTRECPSERLFQALRSHLEADGGARPIDDLTLVVVDRQARPAHAHDKVDAQTARVAGTDRSDCLANAADRMVAPISPSAQTIPQWHNAIPQSSDTIDELRNTVPQSGRAFPTSADCTTTFPTARNAAPFLDPRDRPSPVPVIDPNQESQCPAR